MRYFKYIFISIFILIFLFTVCLTSFAADYSFYLDSLSYTVAAPNTFVVSHLTASGRTFSQVTCSSSSISSSLIFFFSVPENLIVGQTYIIDFYMYRSNGSNAYFLMSETNDNNDGNSYHTIFEAPFNELCVAGSWNNHVKLSFVYNGYRYLIFTFQGISANSSGFDARFTSFDFNRYNPNAALESAVDEQNSLIDEQNSRLSEQNSLIDEQNSLADEQNSLIDEQNSKLFDGTEEYTGYEDYQNMEDSVIEGMTQYADEMINFGHDITQSNRLKKGVLALTYFFNILWTQFAQVESFNWIRLLVYLSAFCSILLLILHSGLIRRSGSSRGGKGD